MLTIVSVILLLVTICSLPAKGIRNITVSDKKEIRFTFNDRPIVIDISLRSLVLRWLTLAIGAAAYFWVRDLLGVDDAYNWGSFIYVTSGAALFLFIVAVYGWPRKSK